MTDEDEYGNFKAEIFKRGLVCYEIVKTPLQGIQIIQKVTSGFLSLSMSFRTHRLVRTPTSTVKTSNERSLVKCHLTAILHSTEWFDAIILFPADYYTNRDFSLD